ncbi:uncharacterized protein AMSG_06668 [Thecamonas trahens ATCC 50062]|uniref:Methyltransferase domain-containing protein n=1 Tax=Thecamonas trahens ATCC 50062 TaxID=461836 RepID=A0A0L0DEQ4_THETB|nr:hypothetical protein AMSG_06668 [Thecamonas trahens ATCC 50062]KNC50774.1 hypothetical protein AMSG_06668 [Thecamonas trahens ATCC 50062]|eukprot:XP_013756735.1 hypothetical protein AMSG_06668 [Thecamonas trahens ATCC 50062]
MSLPIAAAAFLFGIVSGVVAAIAIRPLRTLIHLAATSRSRYDASHRLLNVAASGPTTAWMNLGLWTGLAASPSAANAFVAANERLADALAAAAGLSEGMHVVDVGCGCGDALERWLSVHGASSALGITAAPQQAAIASARLEASGATAGRVVLARAEELEDVVAGDGRRPHAILALDAAYHFATREAFAAAAARVLAPGGVLATAGLMAAVPWDELSVCRKALLACVLAAGGVPRANFAYDAAGWRSKLEALGFVSVVVDDVTDGVFAGFDQFMAGHAEALAAAGVYDTYVAAKFRVAAAGFRRLAAGGLVRFVIARGRLPQAADPD